MNVAIEQTLHCGVTSLVELPVDDWSEVVSWHVKWDVLFLTTNSGEFRIELDSDVTDTIDWKRPSGCQVLSVNREGVTDYEHEFASY